MTWTLGAHTFSPSATIQKGSELLLKKKKGLELGHSVSLFCRREHHKDFAEENTTRREDIFSTLLAFEKFKVTLITYIREFGI